MAAAPHPVSSYTFGPFIVDPSSGELLKFGTRLRLPKQPFQILITLLDRHGEVVTRETLRQELWREDTFVDFDHGLNAAINRLRQTLGDEAATPRFIETIPGRGYRFIAPVESPNFRPVIVPMPPPQKRRRLWLWSLPVVAALIFGAGYWLGNFNISSTLPAPIRYSIQAPPGTVFEPSSARQPYALSADGRRLAFTVRGQDGMMSIWVRDLSESDSRLLPATRGAHSVEIGPDGNTIYYTASGQLKKTDWRASTEQVLDAVDANLLCGAWHRPGEILFANRGRSWIVSLSGAPRKVINRGYIWPQALPDGQSFLYGAWDAKRATNQLRVATLENPAGEIPLFDSDARVFLTPNQRDSSRSWLLYMNESNLLARPFDPHAKRLLPRDPQTVAAGLNFFRPTASIDAAASATTLVWLDHPNKSQLAWVDRQGREISSVGPVLESFIGAKLSRDTRSAAIGVWDRSRGVTSIWNADLSSGAVRKIAPSPKMAASPVFSPDGKTVVVAQSNGSTPVLTMLPLEDGAPIQPLPAQDFQLPTDWSPDGRFIALTNAAFAASASERNASIFLVDMARGRELVALLDSPFNETGGVFSPSGQAFAFISNDSGKAELYVQKFDPTTRSLAGARKQVSRGVGALVVRWPKPGGELYFLAADGNIHAASIARDLTPSDPIRLFAVSQQSRSVLHGVYAFDVAPGGQRFLLPTYRGEKPLSLNVVLNWQSLLKD